MCANNGWLLSAVLLLAVIQSVVWIALSVCGGLVYLCVVDVPPYKDGGDFFRVTTVKLYFEGPECIPDGSYLGKLNEDYRNPEVLRLFTPDKVFAVMVAYFILNVAYYFLSIRNWLARKPKSAAEGKRQRELLLGWSVLTLVICAVDAVFSAKLILDVISLSDYMGEKEENADFYLSSANANVPYIPLLLALISSRFIGVWLWNFLIGLLFFFNALCGKTHLKHSKKTPDDHPTPAKTDRSTRDVSTSITHTHGPPINAYAAGSLDLDMEAVTAFSEAPPKTTHPRDKNDRWSYLPSHSFWSPSKPHPAKDAWQMTNEGFVGDDPVAEPEKPADFDHDLKNFEQGYRKIKVAKPPLGKPVSVPVPPPLPTSGSCNC